MLTISQLAAYAGVTVRAVRHYHQRGLLPEPERDASGYRRYDAQAVIDLPRIRTIADAGVSLARVESLLTADPGGLADTVEELDAELSRRIKQLREHRKRLAQLAAGERLYLPEEVVAYLDRLREIGISDRLVQSERDGWILLAARMPEHVGAWASEKRAGFDDPDVRRLYLAYDQAFDWSPDDPRLEQIAAGATALMTAMYAGKEPTAADVMIMNDIDVLALITSHALQSPAWRRIEELANTQLQRLVQQADHE